MIRDGGVPDLRWHLLDPGATKTLALAPDVFGLGGGEPVTEQRAVDDTPCARMTRMHVALHHVYAELLRAHSETVAVLGQLRSDRERMGGALAEARDQHEALCRVRGAAESVAVMVRRLEGRSG